MSTEQLEKINQKLDLILTILRQKLELADVDKKHINEIYSDPQPEIPDIDHPPAPGPDYAIWKAEHWEELTARELATMEEDPPGLDDPPAKKPKGTTRRRRR